jgi:RNA polymerase sigma factor (sigma-70 family)
VKSIGAVSQGPGRAAAQSQEHGWRPRGEQTAGLSLVEQLREGDRDAMSEVFAQHLDVIYNYCYRRTSSWAAAEDLSATVFLEVWRHRHRAVELDGSVLPWLYGIATNVCRNHLRSRRRGTEAVSRLELVEVATPAARLMDDEVAGRIDADRRLRRALAALAKLPTADQDVFVLICWEQLGYAEAAQALGLPIGTVRSRLARVRRYLRVADEEQPGASRSTTAATDRGPVQEDDHV